jgi:hypothetical protein
MRRLLFLQLNIASGPCTGNGTLRPLVRGDCRLRFAPPKVRGCREWRRAEVERLFGGSTEFGWSTFEACADVILGSCHRVLAVPKFRLDLSRENVALESMLLLLLLMLMLLLLMLLLLLL